MYIEPMDWTITDLDYGPLASILNKALDRGDTEGV